MKIILQWNTGATISSVLFVKVINIKEIDGSKEEQYVYPCYAYDNGSCSIMDKYDLNTTFFYLNDTKNVFPTLNLKKDS